MKGKTKNTSVTNVFSVTGDMENYLEEIIASIPCNMFIISKEGVWIWINDNDAKFLGFKRPEDVIGLSYEDIKKRSPWLADVVNEWQKDHFEIITTGKPKLNIEYPPFITPDGKEKYYLVNRAPLFDKHKNIIGSLGVSFDITERRVMERELQLVHERAKKLEGELLAKVGQDITGQILCESKSSVAYVKKVQFYLENIIGRLPAKVYWLSRDLVYLGCNDRAAKFLGLKSPQDIVGCDVTDFKKTAPWTAEFIEGWRRANLHIVKTGKPMLDIESGPFIIPTGEKLYYLVHRIPLFDNSGEVAGIVVVSIDISDRKKYENLRKEQGVIEKTSKFMRMLAGSIAHELRTPLAIIGLSADLLKVSPAFSMTNCHEKDKLGKHFKSIKHAIQLASHIIDNMLVVLKTLSSGVQIKSGFKKLAIVDGLTKMLQTYPFLDHERSLIKVYSNPARDFFYQGDEILTQHLLSNLIRNALQAVKEAEKGEITIRFDSNDKCNILVFTDTALGIPEENLLNIFDQFASNKQLGAGLGLAFCKEVMQFYGGDISCKSKLGEYTEFRLYFPKINPNS